MLLPSTLDALALELLPWLYEGATDTRGYRPFVNALTAAVGCPAGVTLRGAGEEWIEQTWAGLPADFEHTYFQKYHADNPWTKLHSRLSVGDVAIGDAIVPRDELEQA